MFVYKQDDEQKHVYERGWGLGLRTREDEAENLVQILENGGFLNLIWGKSKFRVCILNLKFRSHQSFNYFILT